MLFKYLYFIFFLYIIIYIFFLLKKLSLYVSTPRKKRPNTSESWWSLQNGGLGRGCCKACPNHRLGGPVERTTWERRWKKRRLPYAQLLGATEGCRGGRGYLPAAGNKTERLLPFLLHQFKAAQEWTQGSHRQSNTIYKMERKTPTTVLILTRSVGLEGTKCM